MPESFCLFTSGRKKLDGHLFPLNKQKSQKNHAEEILEGPASNLRFYENTQALEYVFGHARMLLK